MSRPPGFVELPEGVDPALEYDRPDIELRVLRAVKPLGGIITWVYTAGQGDPPAWVSTANIQVDVRANNRSNAAQRADAVRRAVCALPWADWPDGVINRVDVIDGPFWQPDPSTNAPRYVVRFAIVYHPRAQAPAEPGWP